MDLSSKEFTLNFRGFEQDDPETVKRFTAFCEANFALDPEIFSDTKEDTDTVVLTHGESSEALEALATVLREIGARVEVSRECRFVENAQFGGPSTQELHRLFEPHNDEGVNDTDGPSCPYPPLGRTLYLLTQSDGVFDRRRLRPKTFRSDAPQEPGIRTTRRRSPLLVVSGILLCIGILALVAATALVKGYLPTLGGDQRSSLLSREVNERTRGDLPVREAQATRTLSASARVQGFSVDVKVLASSSSLSLSGLTLIPNDRTRMNDGSMITKAVGDPTFLAQTVPGEWSGRVQLSVFVDMDGRESHITIPAWMSVKMSSDNTTGRAVIAITNDPSKESLDQNGGFGSLATARLASVAVSDLALS